MGDVVSVYAQPEAPENFWLFRVQTVHSKKIEGLRFDKITTGIYKTGNCSNIYGKNIVRSSKHGRNIYLFHLSVQSDGTYVLSNDAQAFLESHCKF